MPDAHPSMTPPPPPPPAQVHRGSGVNACPAPRKRRVGKAAMPVSGVPGAALPAAALLHPSRRAPAGVRRLCEVRENLLP